MTHYTCTIEYQNGKRETVTILNAPHAQNATERAIRQLTAECGIRGERPAPVKTATAKRAAIASITGGGGGSFYAASKP